ncbi:NUDIX hydrolase [Paenibacillus sp. NPDC056579]|uniref:NUDIX hydrolase n=1 Tax=unclassified Paenibacillus TaxID=185978 RepID=UPI001EF957E3|nr:NUDIX hydrolase [Paenibacillus sp. H1-7]ULL17231.1 NUDIX hydrolase [Paenibacillus sp. H1-7]
MFFVNARAFIERDGKGGGTEIVIQKRVKPGEPVRWELPGGRIEPFESLTAALRREVMEETGLTVVTIEGEETRVDTVGINPEFEVECIRPFAAYQTIHGSIDSVGYYFRCEAEGELVEHGDGAANARWIGTSELQSMFQEDPLQFSGVDRAGILYYLKWLEQEKPADGRS